jgi:hypothetical protein
MWSKSSPRRDDEGAQTKTANIALTALTDKDWRVQWLEGTPSLTDTYVFLVNQCFYFHSFASGLFCALFSSSTTYTSTTIASTFRLSAALQYTHTFLSPFATSSARLMHRVRYDVTPLELLLRSSGSLLEISRFSLRVKKPGPLKSRRTSSAQVPCNCCNPKIEERTGTDLGRRFQKKGRTHRNGD